MCWSSRCECPKAALEWLAGLDSLGLHVLGHWVSSEEVDASSKQQQAPHFPTRPAPLCASACLSTEQACLAFLPAFHLEYEHGESFNAHGERVPARYEAVIAGTGEMACWLGGG